MIKVMLITETCKDGVGRHVADLARYLDKNEYEVMVVHGTRRVDDCFEATKTALKGVVHYAAVPHFNREIHPLDDIRSFCQVMKCIRQFRPDVIHCHSSKAGVIGRIAAHLYSRKIQVTYTPHAYAIQNPKLDPVRYQLYAGIERLLDRWTKNRTIHVSVGEHRFALEHRLTQVSRSTVIYNGIEKVQDAMSRNEARVALNLPVEKAIIGCIARVFDQKNPEGFIGIARQVIISNPETVFCWLGEGEHEDRMRHIVEEDETLRDRVHFVGYRTQARRYLPAFDLFLSTARYEGLPYTLIEAAQQGVAAVATRITGNDEAVIDGKTGLLYEPDNVVQGAASVVRLLEDGQLRKDFGMAAMERVEQSFAIEQMIRKISEIYMDRA